MSAKVYGLLAIIAGILVTAFGFFVTPLDNDMHYSVITWGVLWIIAGIIMLLYYAFLTPR